MRKRDYALYHNDDFICWGTKDEIAKFQGWEVSTVDYLSSSSWARKRKTEDNYIIIRIEDDEGEEE